LLLVILEEKEPLNAFGVVIKVKYILKRYSLKNRYKLSSSNIIYKYFDSDLEYDLWYESFKNKLKPNYKVINFRYEKFI